MDNFLWCLDEDMAAPLGSTRHCLRCGSRALFPVVAWINRKPPVEESRETGISRYWREQNQEIAELERMMKLE